MGFEPGDGAGVNAFGRALAAHRAVFGDEPVFGAHAPGRVNLIGEHTDYNDGFVLPIAIGLRCVAVASPSPAHFAVHAADLGETWTTTEPWAEPGNWRSYIAGVLVGVSGLFHVPFAHLRVTIASDVPIGAGLASSAAFEVAFATLLNAAYGLDAHPLDLARVCCWAEREHAGVPCGIMDQFAAALSRPHRALLIDCRDESAAPVRMPGARHATVVVMNSGVRHALAAGEYAARRDTCRRAAAALGVPSLRDADAGAVSRARLPAPEHRAARHVVSENARTLAMVQALRARDLEAAGALMRASHASLRDDFRVSCPELDTLVEVAGAVPGVFGARMTGAGFGGCAVALARPRAVALLRDAVNREYPARHGRTADVFAVAAADGAVPLRLGGN